MSIQSEIDRISGNVQDTISTIQQTGVTVPPGANSDDLPYLAAALANEKQDKLIGTQGQVVGFDSQGNAVAQAAPSGGKRVCRFVVGTSTAGWTSADCDYLCDGTADDVEINAAIQALPTTGGEIVILDGTYNITATIDMLLGNVKLSGNSPSTVLKRMWDSTTSEGVITISAPNGGCCVENLTVDGNKEDYPSLDNDGIYVYNSGNNTITGNTCNNNSSYGICVSNSGNNTITGNTCNNNSSYGIYVYSSDNDTVTGNTCNNNSCGIDLSNNDNSNVTGNICNNNGRGVALFSSDNNTVIGNTCNNNSSYGIYVYSSDNNTVTGNTCNNDDTGIYVSASDNNTVTGNTCIRGTGQASDYDGNQYTIQLNGTYNDYNLIADNNIMGKNYVSGGGTGNEFINNKYQ